MRWLYSFGANRNGQLGIGDSVAYSVTPTRVILPPGGASDTDEVSDIAAGSYHTVCVTAAGAVYGWGQNQFGQLHADPCAVPVSPTPMLLSLPFLTKGIACGEAHTVFLTRDYDVFVCGSKRRASQPLSVVLTSLSHGVGRVVSVCASLDTSFAMTSHGDMYAWGAGVPGMLLSSQPVRVSNMDTAALSIVKALASRGHCVALTSSGDIRVVGAGPYGELGLGREKRSVQAWSALRVGGDVRDIAVGHHHTVLLNHEGVVGVCGNPGGGRLGREVCSPMVIPGLTDIVGVAAGAAFTLAWSHTGKLYSWGSNGNGQLGVSPVSKYRDTPTVVEGTWPSGCRIVKAVGGESHSAVLLSDTHQDYPQPHFLNITFNGPPSSENTREAPISVVPDGCINLSFGRSSASPAPNPSFTKAKETTPPNNREMTRTGSLLLVGIVALVGAYARRWWLTKA